MKHGLNTVNFEAQSQGRGYWFSLQNTCTEGILSGTFRTLHSQVTVEQHLPESFGEKAANLTLWALCMLGNHGQSSKSHSRDPKQRPEANMPVQL